MNLHGIRAIYRAEMARTRRTLMQSIIALLRHVDEAGVRFKDLQTTQSSLEDIFVSLVREAK